MTSQRVNFISNGNELSGALELPPGPVRCYAIFAHCFTCSKNIAAASQVAKALSELGIAVLRFDFTGLGNSEGDFANTNFSSNLQDLEAAADFLRENHAAPRLLVGHSLGGAAALMAAGDIPEVTAVATIGAPRSATHVAHNFHASLDEINTCGEADVCLGPRTFKIKKQFLDDIEKYGQRELRQLRKAVLICHSPLDEVVEIAEAEKIYRDLLHPKSFVSLDKADHLLTDKNDAHYAAHVIAAWAGRYIPASDPEIKRPEAPWRIRVEEQDHRLTQIITSQHHHWFADEPVDKGGRDQGPDPYDHLLAALGACTAMTLRLYANHKNLKLDHVKVSLRHSRDYREDCDQPEQNCTKLELIERVLEITGDLSTQERERLLDIANRCPVHKTLTGDFKIDTRLS